MVRRRSLNKDKADWSQFRFGRDRHMGVSISNEFYQPVPFFFTREGAQLNLIGQYRGASAFMLCNGPSLKNMNLNLLNKPGIITYGMNNGPKTFRPNMWTCVDNPERFIKSIWLDPRIQKFVPHAHLEKKIFDSVTWKQMDIRVGECPNIVAYHRNEKFMADRFLFEDTINWGNHKNHGGGRSVMLPVLRILFLLGFRTVYLVGADFKMDSENTYHFDEQRAAGSVRGNRSTYNRLQNEYFPQLKPYFDAEGFKVFNCTPESGLTAFPTKSFEEAVIESTAYLGDLTNERTYGLYGDMSKRQDLAVEPSDEEKRRLAEEEMNKLEKKANKIPEGYVPREKDLAEFEKYKASVAASMAQQNEPVPQFQPEPIPQPEPKSIPQPIVEAPAPVQQVAKAPQTINEFVNQAIPEGFKPSDATMASLRMAQEALDRELTMRKEKEGMTTVYYAETVEKPSPVVFPPPVGGEPAYVKDLSNMNELVATQPVYVPEQPKDIYEPETGSKSVEELPSPVDPEEEDIEAEEIEDVPFQSPFVDLVKQHDK